MNSRNENIFDQRARFPKGGSQGNTLRNARIAQWTLFVLCEKGELWEHNKTRRDEYTCISAGVHTIIFFYRTRLMHDLLQNCAYNSNESEGVTYNWKLKCVGNTLYAIWDQRERWCASVRGGRTETRSLKLTHIIRTHDKWSTNTTDPLPTDGTGLIDARVCWNRSNLRRFVFDISKLNRKSRHEVEPWLALK